MTYLINGIFAACIAIRNQDRHGFDISFDKYDNKCIKHSFQVD